MPRQTPTEKGKQPRRPAARPGRTTNAGSGVGTAERRRMRTILARLVKAYPEAKCSLDFGDPWQLLVAVILSAQCTDERVNMVTPHLFARWPGPRELAAAPQQEIETVIHSTGFYRAKARHLKMTAEQILREHDGQVPARLEDLVTLPGVARKTANVVLHVAYPGADPAAGIAVDTHVTRLANRLGFVESPDPRKIEERLMAVVAQRDWGDVTHLLIHHGRAVCIARAPPRCAECVLKDLCPSAAVFLA